MDKVKYTWLFTSLLAALIVGCAGNKSLVENRTVVADVLEGGPGRHFLWKVSDENSHVWVLGSIHFADTSFYPMDSVIEEAFANASELAVEMNVREDSVNQDVVQETLQKGLLPKGTTLNQVVPSAVWYSLDSLCFAWNLPIAMFKGMRPWFVSTTLTALAMERIGLDNSLGIDAVLLDRAKDEGKKIVGIETPAEQIDAMSGNDESDSSGAYYLRNTLREISGLDSMVTRLIRSWKTGDEALLHLVLNGDSAVTETDKVFEKKFEEQIYTRRNGKMAQAIADFLNEDRNVFVVVGVAHLMLDEDNVISLLKQKGFRVERF
ncbi:MAG: TraB/GumN family protein [Fibrobacter sp.]|nr:TraB/GumN family protein [Fibrobacter sp.]